MENAGRAIVLPFKGKVKRNRRFRTGLIKHHLCFNLDEEQTCNLKVMTSPLLPSFNWSFKQKRRKSPGESGPWTATFPVSVGENTLGRVVRCPRF